MNMNIDEVVRLIATATNCKSCGYSLKCNKEAKNKNDYICNQAIDFLQNLNNNNNL